MVMKWGDIRYLQKTAGFLLFSVFVAVPSLAKADTIVTSKTYVDAKITQTISTATATAPSENAVKTAVDAKQAKPTNAIATGKVLSYTGTTTDNVSADYVRLPDFDPSGTVPNSPTFSYVWVQ